MDADRVSAARLGLRVAVLLLGATLHAAASAPVGPPARAPDHPSNRPDSPGRGPAAPKPPHGLSPDPGPGRASGGPPIGPAAGRAGGASASTQPMPPRAGATTTHHWHDGRQRRPLTLDDRLVADFSGGKTSLRAAADQQPGSDPESSPVFRDSSGQPRALPGGVVVVFKEPVDDAAARTLLESVGAQPLKPIGTTMWLVESPPGLAALELANRLHETGRFAAAEPNWWRPRAHK